MSMLNKKSSSKYGYGIHNVNKEKLTKSSINFILKKSWANVTSMDLYKLYRKNWKTEDISRKYRVSVLKVLNKLRCL